MVVNRYVVWQTIVNLLITNYVLGSDFLVLSFYIHGILIGV